MAHSVINNPLYDFVMENLSLDMGQLKILAAANKKIKNEKDILPEGVVQEQGETIVVDGSVD